MGILDNKSRVMDTILTSEGRRQLADGHIRLGYVSFTDTGAYYEADANSGSSDASSRIYFEAQSLPVDQIAFQADDSGRLSPFSGQTSERIRDGQIVSYSESATSNVYVTGSSRLLSGDEFLDVASTLLSTAPENFRNLRLIGTRDALFEDSEFAIGPSTINFTITNERPLPDSRRWAANINSLDSLFNDPRLSRLPNFAYLPPINRKRKNDTVTKLGYYPPWGAGSVLDYDTLSHELSYYDRLGYSKKLTFDPTSRSNRLMAQFFEVNYNVVKKLDVVDFGQHINAEGSQVHVFFAGNVVSDENGSQTFIHLFTLVFE